MEKGGRVVRSVERLAALEGLRGLAAFYVVLSHIVTMVEGVHGRRNLPDYLQILFEPFRYGHLAVAAFIVLSGFCLQFAMFEHSDGLLKKVGWFYKRRARRILPPYYACLALSLVVALYITPQEGEPFNQYLPVTLENVLAHIFLVHNAQVEWMYKINGVLWSIAIEFQLYIVFPVLLSLLLKLGRIQTLIAATALCAGAIVVFPASIKLYPWFAVLFIVGMIFAQLAYRPNLKIGVIPRAVSVTAFLALCGTYGMEVFRAPQYASDAVFGFAIGCVLYALTVTAHSTLDRVLAWRPLVSLGAFSYSLYLMHHPIQQAIYLYRPRIVQTPTESLAFLLLIGLPIILTACYLFYLIFERPFISARSSKTDPSSQARGIVQLPIRTATLIRSGVIESDRSK